MCKTDGGVGWVPMGTVGQSQISLRIYKHQMSKKQDLPGRLDTQLSKTHDLHSRLGARRADWSMSPGSVGRGGRHTPVP